MLGECLNIAVTKPHREFKRDLHLYIALIFFALFIQVTNSRSHK
jgi:hypothetical protein